MLPSGIATLLWKYLADHPELAFCGVQGAVYVSSPKYHAQPLGKFDDKSVNDTDSGAVPEEILAVKFATGADGAALTTPKSIARPIINRQ
jgi:hypothetical protein